MKSFRGTLVMGTADNLASQMIGGYKGLASALRKCLAIEDMVSKVKSGMNIWPVMVLCGIFCNSLNLMIFSHVP